MFILYCHTNLKNGKRYVGWSSTSMETRWNGHLSDARRGSLALFHKALRKHGVDDDVWQHQVLETVDRIDIAKTAEKRWIAELRTHAYSPGHWGYNQTLGGEGVAGIRDSDETRKRKSESQKRRHKLNPLPKETRRLARKKHQPVGADARLKMSQAKFKPVAQCDMSGVVIRIWSSPKCVQDFKPAQVARAARGMIASHGGFLWRYVDGSST